MGIIKEHLDYLKDNPQGYWFKRKLYGWGWTPARPQGWLVILGYVLSVIAVSFIVDEVSSGMEIVLTFVLPVTLLTIILIGICYKKGERPRWQWGDRV